MFLCHPQEFGNRPLSPDHQQRAKVYQTVRAQAGPMNSSDIYSSRKLTSRLEPWLEYSQEPDIPAGSRSRKEMGTGTSRFCVFLGTLLNQDQRQCNRGKRTSNPEELLSNDFWVVR